MFQPTWPQSASAQPPLDVHAQDRGSLAQDMHPTPHMHYDSSQLSHQSSSDHHSMYDASIATDPNAAPPPGASSYSFAIQQQQHRNLHQLDADPSYQLAHQPHHVEQGHQGSNFSAEPQADMSASRPASMQSGASLYLGGSSMALNNSGVDLGQNDYLAQQNDQYLSRPHTGSEHSWSEQVIVSNDANHDGSASAISAGLQRAARPAALKIDMASVASNARHDLSDSTAADPVSAEPGSAVTPHALQTRFAPLPQLQPSMYDGQTMMQKHSNSDDPSAVQDASMPASSGLMPAFGTESSFLHQGTESKGAATVHQGPNHVSNSPHVHHAEGVVGVPGVPGVPERFGPSSNHLGVSASPGSPMMSQFSAGHYSPSSTLSGAFSSRPGSRPASRGLKSVASFTSSAGTGIASGSEAQAGRPRSSSGSGVATRPISALTRTTSMQNEIASYQAGSPHPGLSQSRSVHNLGQMQSPAMSGPLSSPRHPGSGHMEPWSPAHSQMTHSHSFRGAYSGPGFQTPQMQQFSPTLTSPAQSQYSPQAHFGSHSSGMMPFFSPSIETTQQFNASGGHPTDGFDIAGFSEQRLSSALANSASISSGPPSAAHQREGHSTPTIVEEEEEVPQGDGRSIISRHAHSHSHSDLRFEHGFQPHPMHHSHQQHHPLSHHPSHPHAHPHPAQHYAVHPPPPVLQRSRSDQIQGLAMEAPQTFRNHMPYPPNMRPSLYQQVSMAEMNQLRHVHGLGVTETNFGDCSAFIQDYVRQYISTPSRLGLGERNVLIMTTRVAQKSYGAEKRFLCPPPLVILIGSSWWNVCPASTRPSPFAPAGAVDPDQAAPTVLSPPRVTINISGEPGVQDGALEWASSSGRLIDVGNPSSEMAISGRCIGKQLYISDVDEKRRHVEALVAISVPGSSPMDRRLLGTFPSRPIKVISKPSKKRQSSRNTELCVNHGSVISLFHRLRSQTVSTRYLCVSGAPSWFKGSDNQPFLNMNPRDQKGQEPPSCFVAKMSSWDPFIIYLVDPSKRADATPSEPLQPPVKGYPPPPPNALPTTGLTSSQMTIHYNQPIVLQCLNTAVVSPVMVVRKVEKGTTVLGGALAGTTESISREAFGDPVSQLHKIALEVLEDPAASVPRPKAESGESMSPGNSGPFLACLNESVGMHRPSEPRKWVVNSSFSVPSTPTTPVTSMNLAAMEGGDLPPSGFLPTSPTSAAAYAAAQTRYSLSASRAGAPMMSPSVSSSSHDVSAMEPPPSSDGGKVKRPRRVSSSVVVQKERAAAAAAASKNRRRGQSLSVVGMQNQGLSDVEMLRRPGSYANSMTSESSAAGSTAPGAMWSVEVADSDIWTVVGTDIARHSFYVPPQIVGGSQPKTNITDGNIAHLITVPAPAQPITPIPIITNVVAPQRDGRSPMPAPSGDQSPGLVTILGENLHPNLFVFFGDWKSTHVEVRTRQTIVCAAPPAFDQGLPRGRVPILIVRHDGVIFPTDFHYQC
ncbi:related to J kappa-recombination signal binding protein [Sporisorium reilianum SRZ2]|uniref:Related to J kappa-recombination signal binding protein n=1 Tax=Sporisorium reilianum (strain SRZ2) TaxID=999809 RepID=E6ZZ04_SPORE|nr:related to J kappa-recombination signal binding protein [Sporisorium reilianum SRZ2]